MIIDIFKNNIFSELEKYNRDIIQIDMEYISRGLVPNSYWFDPYKVNQLPPETTNPNYNLILYCANYLPIFLINLLYDKSIIIEDFGVGDGRFFYYLSKLGYSNFSAWDNWVQCPKELFEAMMNKGNIEFNLNDIDVSPKVVNNSMSPFEFPTYKFDERNLPDLEIITFYQNKDWEKNYVPTVLEPRGYVFLCRDQNDKAQAYCKINKYIEFKEKLEEYKV